MNINGIVYDLINDVKNNNGSALIDCGDAETAEEVRAKVKEAIKFYSNLDVTIIREKEVNIYSWALDGLIKEIDPKLNDIHERKNNVGGKSRTGGTSGRWSRRNIGEAKSQSGRDKGFGF
tara:strand:- start:1045 stop:1404 length:360 start_codon:yes stop_codon:yes gene_type:complete